jgi:hypothetical protein
LKLGYTIFRPASSSEKEAVVFVSVFHGLAFLCSGLKMKEEEGGMRCLPCGGQEDVMTRTNQNLK